MIVAWVRTKTSPRKTPFLPCASSFARHLTYAMSRASYLKRLSNLARVCSHHSKKVQSRKYGTSQRKENLTFTKSIHRGMWSKESSLKSCSWAMRRLGMPWLPAWSGRRSGREHSNLACRLFSDRTLKGRRLTREVTWLDCCKAARDREMLTTTVWPKRVESLEIKLC